MVPLPQLTAWAVRRGCGCVATKVSQDQDSGPLFLVGRRLRKIWCVGSVGALNICRTSW